MKICFQGVFQTVPSNFPDITFTKKTFLCATAQHDFVYAGNCDKTAHWPEFCAEAISIFNH